MNSSIWFIFAVIAIALVQSEQLDAGPQIFADKTPAEQKPQKRETKEFVVYLTPSQIKTLQEGKGFLNAEPVDEAGTSQETQGETEPEETEPEETEPEETEPEETEPEETEQEESEQEESEQEESEPEEDDFQLGSLQLDSQLEEEDNQLPSSIPVEEPTSEELEDQPQFNWIFRPPQDKKFVPSPEDNYAYLRYYPETEVQSEEAQPESEDNEEDNEEVEPEIQQQRFRLVPYESETENSEPGTTEAPQEDPIRERWLRLLEQNRAQLKRTKEKAAVTTTTTTEQPQAEPETTLARLRFSARYNDQKQAIKKEEQRRKDITEKQKALIRADARANKAPVVVRKEVTNAKQAPLIKHVKVHTPILVPIPEPFEVKVPHPFPVPLEIFRPIAAKATKAKKVAKKPSAAARAEEKPKTPKKSSTTTEKPAAERRTPVEPEKEVPVELSQRQRNKPERITIIRHVFEN